MSETPEVQPTQPEIPPMPSSAAMIATLGLIAMMSGLLVVLVYEFTKPIIDEKERLALEAAVFQVVPGVEAEKAVRVSYALTADAMTALEETEADQANVYAVYDEAGSLKGLAMKGAAQGYQDVVRVLFGYNPECECVIGMTVLKSVDTPGLGDKGTVEGNAKFMDNFKALDVSLAPDKSAVAHPVETVKHGTKSEDWQVDAMSGATITSRAIGNGLRETTVELLPLLAKHLDEIKVKS